MPAFEATLERWQQELTERLLKGPVRVIAPRSSGATFTGLRAALSSPTRMAHPAIPWRYGTLIRPTLSNNDVDPWVRHFYVGPNGNDTVASIWLNDDDSRVGVPYTHLRETLLELWEADE